MSDNQVVMAVFGGAIIAFICWIIWTAGKDPVNDTSAIDAEE